MNVFPEPAWLEMNLTLRLVVADVGAGDGITEPARVPVVGLAHRVGAQPHHQRRVAVQQIGLAAGGRLRGGPRVRGRRGAGEGQLTRRRQAHRRDG